MIASRTSLAEDKSLPTVLHVRVVTGQGGGPDKTILRSPRYMRSRGYNEICAYLRSPDDAGFAQLERQATEQDAEILAVDDRGPLDWNVVRQLVAFCRMRSVQIWHGHDYKSNALGLLVARFVPLRLLTTVHGWVHHTRRTPLYYLVDRCCLRWYERVLCVSSDLLTTCRQLGVRDRHCQLLENGIELEHFRRSLTPAAARHALGLDPTIPLVGGVGRLAAEKHFEALLTAVQLLLARGQRVQAAIIGDGPERAALQQRAADLQLQHAVRFVGHCSDVRPWYEAMDLFALASLREAMPNVVLEAMAMQTPVVATEIAGVPDMLAHGQAGRLVPPGDAPALATALHELLANPTRRHAFSDSALALVGSRFSFERRMDRMQNIYDDLLQRPPSQRLVP